MKIAPVKGRVFVLFSALFLAVLWPAGTALAAGQAELAAFLEDLEKEVARVGAFSCAFIQERHLAMFSRPVIFHGRLTIARPDRLRWEFTRPIPSVLIFNGKSGSRCNDREPPHYFDLRSDPVMQAVAQQLWTWLGGDYKGLSDLYHLAMAGDSRLAVTPKEGQMAEFIATVTISFDPQSKQPQQVEIVEPGGDLTRIMFSDYRFNLVPDETLFSRCEKSE